MSMSENSQDLSKANLDELRINLLRDFWIKATMALTDTIGAKSALDVLTPYFIHHAKYTESLILSSQIKFSTMEEIFNGFASGNQMVNRTKVSGELREKGVLYKATDCATKGASSVACICNCRLTSEPVLEDFNSEYRIMMNQSLSEGDPLCSWTIAKKERLYTTDLGSKIADLEPPSVDKSVADEAASQILGEFWSISTRAFIEAVGQEKTREILTERQRTFGKECAVNIIAISGSERGTVEGAGRAVGFLNEVFQMKGDDTSLRLNIIGREISECPFSGSPVEVCAQYEAFCNGICEAIDPSFEFVYDRLMTKGDKTCHWTISKKGESSKEKATEDDALKTLRLRFAKGEITTEQYRQLRDILLEK
jgi:hypothetical protein